MVPFDAGGKLQSRTNKFRFKTARWGCGHTLARSRGPSAFTIPFESWKLSTPPGIRLTFSPNSQLSSSSSSKKRVDGYSECRSREFVMTTSTGMDLRRRSNRQHAVCWVGDVSGDAERGNLETGTSCRPDGSREEEVPGKNSQAERGTGNGRGNPINHVH